MPSGGWEAQTPAQPRKDRQGHRHSSALCRLGGVAVLCATVAAWHDATLATSGGAARQLAGAFLGFASSSCRRRLQPSQVPTDYYSVWGRKTHTYQYSVTEYYHQFRGGEETPPAVYLL